MYRVRVTGDNGYDRPVIRRFRVFPVAYKFARRWVNDYLNIPSNTDYSAVLTPNCCYAYPPTEDIARGKPCLVITIVDEADDPVPFVEEVPPNGWS